MNINKKTLMYLAVMMAVIPLVLFPVNGEIYFHGKIILSLMATVLLVAIEFKQIKKSCYFSPFTVMIALLTIISIVSTFLSVDKKLSFYGVANVPEGLISLLIGYAACFIGYYSVRNLNESQEIKGFVRLADIVLIAAAVIGVVAVLEYFYIIKPLPEYLGFRTKVNLNFSTIGNRNFVGTYSVLMLPAAIGMYVLFNRKRGIIYSVLITVLLVISQTRSAYLAFAFILVMYTILALIYKGPRVRLLVITGILFLIIVGGIYILTDVLHDQRIVIRLQKLYSDLFNYTNDSAGSDRVLIWKNAFGFAFDHLWIGSGPDTFGILYVKAVGEIPYTYHKVHNEWFQMLITQGVLYLSFYLSLIGYGLIGLIRRNTFLAFLILTTILAYELQSMFNISVAPNAFIFWIVLGMGIGIGKHGVNVTYEQKGIEY